MAGLKLPRWIFSLWCRWFPGRVRVRRRPVVRYAKPTIMILEDRASPTSFSIASPVELAPPPHISQINSDMATAGETRKTDAWAEWVPSEEIPLVSSPRPADDVSVVVHTPTPFQGSSASPAFNQQGPIALNTLRTQQPSPLSTPPKLLPTRPANAGGSGGRGVGGRSTPNAGMGGGRPTGGGGGGPGVVNANQFVGVNFGASQGGTSVNPTPSLSPQTPAQTNVPAPSQESSPSAASPMNYAMTAPSLVQLHYQSLSPSLSHGYGHHHGHGQDPLYVLDMNTGETIPANVTLNTFSTWSENLLAQASGSSITSISWDTSQAPDATNISGQNAANLQLTWSSFTGAARTDTISVTETPQFGRPLTQTMTFEVVGTDSPAYSSSRPTSSSTWPTVLTPDQVAATQASMAAGPYASLGLADGSVQTTFAMPTYNPAPSSSSVNHTPL